MSTIDDHHPEGCRPIGEILSRVEYELSDLGRSLKTTLAPIGDWVLTRVDTWAEGSEGCGRAGRERSRGARI